MQIAIIVIAALICALAFYSIATGASFKIGANVTKWGSIKMEIEPPDKEGKASQRPLEQGSESPTPEPGKEPDTPERG